MKTGKDGAVQGVNGYVFAAEMTVDRDDEAAMLLLNGKPLQLALKAILPMR